MSIRGIQWILWLLAIGPAWAQLPVALSLAQPAPKQRLLAGTFLTDSIEIGRPFRYSLTFEHPASADVLFPDTALHFTPYRVQAISIFTTRTTGTGRGAVSRDSAVYTLLSFETDSVQLLRVPMRIINPGDCTVLFTSVDTVFLRSRLTAALSATDTAGLNPSRPDPFNPGSLTLATELTPAPLRQQFNYLLLVAGLLGAGLGAGAFYALFGRVIRRQWRLYRLQRQHLRFLQDYNRISRSINAHTVAELTQQATVQWKTYLEQLERMPYLSLTTSEIAERINDPAVAGALREADQMIYGSAFSPQSQPALRVLANVATKAYERRREQLQMAGRLPADPDDDTNQRAPATP